ncbi:MAG: hypothetical protein HQL48_11980 [Gammaproteobacteria bacterium]|nr:hypothetical protein [Gammaproteobacteria bacterium]
MIHAQPLSETTVMRLRQHYSDCHFTYCMDDDVIGPSPVHEDEVFNLYLIDGRNHCLTITADYEIATGVVVAEKEA